MTDKITQLCMGFNPRTRRGCDAIATVYGSDLNSFNPRTRRGCDLALEVRRVWDYAFQSTHPQGVRPALVPPGSIIYTVSIHAPAGGAT